MRGVANTLRKVDIFGESVAFSIGDETSVKSLLGSVMTILVTVVTLMYAWNRFTVMVGYEDTRF